MISGSRPFDVDGTDVTVSNVCGFLQRGCALSVRLGFLIRYCKEVCTNGSHIQTRLELGLETP